MKRDEQAIDDLASKFAKLWANRFPGGISMATIQQHFIMHMRSTASECVEAVKTSEVWERQQTHTDMFM